MPTAERFKTIIEDYQGVYARAVKMNDRVDLDSDPFWLQPRVYAEMMEMLTEEIHKRNPSVTQDSMRDLHSRLAGSPNYSTLLAGECERLCEPEMMEGK